MVCRYCGSCEEPFIGLFLKDEVNGQGLEYYVFVCLDCGMVDRIEEV